MSRERFEVSVVPQTPEPIQGVLSRAPIGAQKRENYIKESEELRDRLFKDVPANLRQKWLEWANSGIPTRGEYKLDLSDKITPEEKVRIFLPAVNVMRDIMAEYMADADRQTFPEDERFIIPSTDELLARLHIVDGETFENAVLQETNQAIYSKPVSGTGLPNKHCLVSYDYTLGLEDLDPKDREIELRHTGVHELWESLKYEEKWVPTNDSRTWEGHDLERRVGILSKRPGKSAVANGLVSIQEGFLEYLSRETLLRAGESGPLKSSSYRDEMALVDRIVKSIDVGTVFKATFTKRGFRSLNEALVSKYGKDAYRKLGNALIKDFRDLELKRMLDIDEKEQPAYQRTKRFLRRAEQRDEQTVQVANLRRRIINSVLARGLIPKDKLRTHFGSGDSKGNEFVYGRGLMPNSYFEGYYQDAEKWINNQLISALYKSEDSIFPVMIERNGEETFWIHPENAKKFQDLRDLALIEKRLASCFLVVARRDLNEMGTMCASKVDPKLFYCLIFPENIWEDYRKTRKQPLQTRVITIRNAVQRELMGGLTMNVPDFQSPLSEFLKQPNTDFWVSGVRLPIVEDLS